MIKTTICGNLVYDPELKTVSDEKRSVSLRWRPIAPVKTAPTFCVSKCGERSQKLAKSI